jgi:hypothetical protein
VSGATLINLSADEHMGKLVIEVVGFSATSGSFFSDLIGGARVDAGRKRGFLLDFDRILKHNFATACQ